MRLQDGDFVVGDRFMTFAEVKKKIHQYEKEKFVQFYKRDRRFEAARKSTSLEF